MNEFENTTQNEDILCESAVEETPDSSEVNAEIIQEKSEKSKKSILVYLYEYLETFVYALVLMVVLLLFVFRPVTVDGASMQHTLHHEDKLVISNLLYTPKTGDIVVINPENHDNDQEPIIKRVIATEGQTVFIDYANWAVYVDGVKLDEPYIDAMRKEYQAIFGEGVIMHPSEVDLYNGEFTVSDGMVFVMGDNRNNSRDSRSASYGEMSVNRILGRVILRVSPEFGLVD
ncbi:MAG: signal peptidase I [Ruminococcaceae bacterium]|nr:signal peptidase I [Oscillospiraceae bacterium]